MSEPASAPAGSASVVGQWEMAADLTDSTGNSPVNGSVQGAAAFGQPTIAAGGLGGVAFDGAGFGAIPNAPAYQQQAFGISIYTQISALADTAVRSQIVNKDAAQPPNGVAIEYLQVDGVNRLDPYMRTDAGGAGSARRMAGAGGIADLPLDTGLLVTFTYDPATTPRCKVYLRQDGDSSNRLVGSGLTDESEVTQGWTKNDADLLVAAYFGNVGLGRGAFQRLMIWAGAPSRAQLDGLPAPRTIAITPPSAARPDAVDQKLDLGAGDQSRTINPTRAPSANAVAAVVTIQGAVTGPATAVVSSTDQQTITVKRTGAGAYSLRYRLTNPDGEFDEATLSGTIAAAGSGVVRIPAGGSFVGRVHKPIPNVPKPGYLTPFHEDTASFPGVRIRRIAGDFGTTVPTVGGNWPIRAKHQYISCAPWNHDEDLLFMNNQPLSDGTHLFIDGQTYAVRFKRSMPADGKLIRWRPGHPEQMIYVTGGQVRMYNPYTAVATQLSSFSGSTYTELSFGLTPGAGMNGQISYDGNMMVVSGRRTSDNAPICFWYNIETDQKGPDFLFTAIPAQGTPDHDFITISMCGQFILWAFQGGNDVAVFNLSGKLLANSAAVGGTHPMRDKLKHPDSTVSGDGSTPYLTFANRLDNDVLARVDLPLLTNEAQFTVAGDATISHASANRQWRQRSDGRRFGTSFGVGKSPGPAVPLFGALFRYDIDSGEIHQFGHHRTSGGNSTTGSESWHTPSPSATRSIFTSTFGAPQPPGAGQSADQWYVIEHHEFLNV